MGFSNEEVPEEQKSRLDPGIFHPPWSDREPIVLYRWVVDHDRDAFLIRLWGGARWDIGLEPEPRQYLALSWKGRVVKFDAHYRARESEPAGAWIGCWTVHDMSLPGELAGQEAQVREVIREGLEAMGNPSGHREKLSEVRVDFKPYRAEDWIKL
jgi:hypothetical protein